jgi:hypothetical protein
MKNNNINKVISEELNKMKNLMMTKSSVKILEQKVMETHLNKKKEVIFEQGEAIRNKGEGLGKLTSLLSNLNPIKHSKLPTFPKGKSIINIGTQNIENIQVKTNIGNLYFFAFKPAGYFTDNNFVLNVKDGVATIGTWDLNNLYFKKQGDTSVTDNGFNTTIRLTYLTPQKTSLVDKPEKNVVNNTNSSDKKAQREKIALQNQNTVKEIQRTSGLRETGTLDVQSIEKLIGFLSNEEQPKVQSVQDLVPNAKIQTQDTSKLLQQIKQ